MEVFRDPGGRGWIVPDNAEDWTLADSERRGETGRSAPDDEEDGWSESEIAEGVREGGASSASPEGEVGRERRFEADGSEESSEGEGVHGED